MKAVGQADILVNNAGIIRRANALEYRDEDWDAVIEVNLRSVLHGTVIAVDGGWLAR